MVRSLAIWFRACAGFGVIIALNGCGDDAEESPVVACDNASCTTPPGPLCSDEVLIERQPVGACNASGQCEYAPVETDCAASGGSCIDGRCVGGGALCGTVYCENPPLNVCDGDVAVQYPSVGTCGDDLICQYTPNRVSCATAGQVCLAGACVDPGPDCAANEDCASPPSSTCSEAGDLQTYFTAGTCDAGVCSYEFSTAPCESGFVCDDGTCVPSSGGPCADVTCDSPPANSCTAEGLRVAWDASGTCEAATGECAYTSTTAACPSGEVCDDGACVTDPGPCGGACDSPPDDPFCNGSGQAVTFAGTCDTAVPECVYSEVVTDCTGGDVCLGGTCVDPADVCADVVCNEVPANDCEGNSVRVWAGACVSADASCDYTVASSTPCTGDLQCRNGACVNLCAGVTCVQETDFCLDAATAVRFSAAGTCSPTTGTCDNATVRTEVTCAAGSECEGQGQCVRAWAADDLLISEFLASPAQGGSEGEWFEVYNNTGVTVNLHGLRVQDVATTPQRFTIASDLIMEPSSYAIFARTEGGLGASIIPDYVFGTSMTLANTDDEIVILSGDRQIAALSYTSATFPIQAGFSASLDPQSLEAESYSDGDNWCEGEPVYDDQNNRGTPGGANDDCDNFCADQTCPALADSCFNASTVLRYTGAGVCNPIDGSCNYSGQTTTTPCNINEECISGLCLPVGVVLERGDLVVTEYAANFAGTDTGREWFEVYNTTNTRVVLTGLVISDTDGASPAEYESFTVTTPVVVEANDFVVFASSATAVPSAVSPVYVWNGDADFRLTDADQIILTYRGGTIDSIEYDTAWPSLDGAAAQFAGDPLVEDNGTAEAWCLASELYNASEFGTPGALNSPCDFVTSRPPETGELVITELMIDPTALSDNDGEWFEVHNITSETLNLSGMIVAERDAGGAISTAASGRFVVRDGVEIEAGQWFVFADKAGGLGAVAAADAPDYVWDSGFGFTNSGTDELVLLIGATVIDEVEFNLASRSLGASSGVAANLDVFIGDATSNDDPANWCPAITAFASGDLGTPGEPNDGCDTEPETFIPGPGSLIITEVLAASRPGSPDPGEFVELFHRGFDPVDLDNCVLVENTTHQFPDGLIFEPGDHILIGRSTDATAFGTRQPDVVLPDLALSNSGETLTIRCTDGDTYDVDSFTYTGGLANVGRSAQFNRTITADSITENDNIVNWCVSATDVAIRFVNNGVNDVYGTPGAANNCFTDTVDPGGSATTVWINELHYDSSATNDAGEMFEIAGPSGGSLDGWSVILYNGTNGTSYLTTSFDSSSRLSTSATGVGVLAYSFPTVVGGSFQNGAPDGIALVNPASEVVQFLSYEGTFTASGGPAGGLTSTDIGVSESTSTSPGTSLQLGGTGCAYTDFTWQPSATRTADAVNAAQTFLCVD